MVLSARLQERHVPLGSTLGSHHIVLCRSVELLELLISKMAPTTHLVIYLSPSLASGPWESPE